MPKVETSTPQSRSKGRRSRGARVSTSLAEINVVPLVDVMLVLLVIFMVAAPMMQQGFPVKLPQSRRSTATNAPVTVTVPVSFHKDAQVRLGTEAVPLQFLPERIRQALEGRTEKTVMLACDGENLHQDCISVMDRLREGGVEQVGLQTQPTTGGPR